MHPHRSALVAEVIVLVVLAGADVAILLTSSRHSGGVLAGLFTALTPAIGPAAGILAVVRRRFGRTALITVIVASTSIVTSGVGWLAGVAGSSITPQPAATEIFSLALLTGALLRQLPLWRALPAVLLSGAAMAVAFPLRFGFTSSWALAAIPAALLWGGSVGVGLALRDVDLRVLEQVDTARQTERLVLARDLHDFVAHHITGIVVLAQGAQVVGRSGRGDHGELLTEIEHAGGEALTAMRRLVGMLRDPTDGPDDGLRRLLRDACGGYRDVHLLLDDAVEDGTFPAELTAVAHRIVLESVTNARRHAPAGTRIEVGVRIERQGFTGILALDIVNVAGSVAGGTGGYGLVGMAERVATLGGTLTAGPEADSRWRVAARIPLPLDRTWENA